MPNGEVSVRPATENAPTTVVVDRLNVEHDGAERKPVYRHNPIGPYANYYSWADLANLLRVDIPWWSPLVSDLDAMLTWHPGAPVTRIAPYLPRLDTGHITALATPDRAH